MDSKKLLIGTLVGGIAQFLLGYLFYGLLLMNFFTQHSHSPAGADKAMSDIIWWALILGNFASGALLTYVILKAGNVSSVGNAAGIAATVGLLIALGTDLVRYATENSFDLTALCADVVVITIMTAIAGGLIGIVLGIGKKKS